MCRWRHGPLLVCLLLAAAAGLTAAGDVSPSPAATLPPQYSLRPKFESLGLDARQQGRRGTCTVFAALGALEFHYSEIAGSPINLSEEYTIWAATNLKKNGSAGFNLTTVVRGILVYGVCREEFMPYLEDNDNVRVPDRAAILDAQSRHAIIADLLGFNRGGPLSNAAGDSVDLSTLLAKICSAIHDGSPVSAAVRWPDGPAQFDQQLNLDPVRNTPGASGHEILLVGYDLNPRWPGGGRFEMRNSWGENWGEHGYAYLPFAWIAQSGIEAYVLHPDMDDSASALAAQPISAADAAKVLSAPRYWTINVRRAQIHGARFFVPGATVAGDDTDGIVLRDSDGGEKTIPNAQLVQNVPTGVLLNLGVEDIEHRLEPNFRATFVQTMDGLVVLRRNDDSLLTLPKDSLSPEDIALVDLAPAGPPPPDSP